MSSDVAGHREAKKSKLQLCLKSNSITFNSVPLKATPGGMHFIVGSREDAGKAHRKTNAKLK